MKDVSNSVDSVRLFSTGIDGVGNSQVHQAVANFEALVRSLHERVKSIRSDLRSYVRQVGAERIACAARSKDGFTREQAKKLFYSYRQKKEKAAEQAPEPDRPDDTEARFEKIMVYMEETSKKLDRIENDIGFLKDQVADILKRL